MSRKLLNYLFPSAYHKAITVFLLGMIITATLYRLIKEREGLQIAQEVNKLVGQASEQHNQGNTVRTIELIFQAINLSPDAELPVTARRLLLESYFAPGLQQMFSLHDLSACLEPTQGHQGTIVAFSVFAEGNLFATGGTDGRALIWNTATGCPIREIVGMNDISIVDMAFHPKGDLILVAYRDGTLRLRNRLSFNQTNSERDYNNTGIVWSSVVFNHDGSYFLSGSETSGVIALWNTETGEVIRQFEGHSQRINEIVFDSDSSHFASVSDDGTARVWNVQTGQVELNSPTYREFLTSVSFSSDSRVVIFGSEKGVVRFWDTVTNDLPYERRVHEDEAIRDIRFSNDGKLFLSASNDDKVVVWDTETREVQIILASPHDEMSGIIGAAFIGPMNEVFAVTSVNPQFLSWSIISADRVGPIQFPHDDASQDGTPERALVGDAIGMYDETRGVRLLTASLQGRDTIGLWELKRTAQVQEINLYGPNTMMINLLTFSPDGSTAVAGSRNGELFLLTNNYAQAFYSLEPIPANTTANMDRRIVELEYLPQGNQFVAAIGEELQIWNATTASPGPDRVLYEHDSSIRAFDVSNDGMRLLSADASVIKIHSLGTEENNLIPQLEGVNIQDVCFHPEDQSFFWSDDSGLQRTNLNTGLTLPIEGYRGTVEKIEIAGEYVLTAMNDQTVLLWDMDTMSVLYRFAFDADIISIEIMQSQTQQALAFLENGEIYVINIPQMDDVLEHMRFRYKS